MALRSKLESVRSSSSLFRLSLSFIRTLSAASSSSSPSSSAAVGAAQNPKKSKRRKKKNLFEVAQFLPNWGIGYHMAKTHWKEVSYEITKINLYKVLYSFIRKKFTIITCDFYDLSFLLLIYLFAGWKTWQGMGNCL